MPIEELFSLSIGGLALIPIVVGLVQGIKSLGIDSKYAFPLSLLLGVGLLLLGGLVWQMAIAQGILVGLAASGLYSGTAKTIETLKGE